MSTNLECYLKPYRRRWGLKQDELGRLLGVRTGTIVSRLERGVRDPSLADAYAFEIILGTNPIELFPGLHAKVLQEVIERARSFYDELQGNASRDTELKLDLFEDIFARQEKRSDARYE
jgi:transcriptional regulator with XRE-family HTH domain